MNINPNRSSHIQLSDKVTFYKLSIQEKSQNEDVNICSNIIILKRGKYSSMAQSTQSTFNTFIWFYFSKDTRNDTKIMCYNENLWDATDDVCEMISEWYTCLLYHYNITLFESNWVDTIKKLMDRSINRNVHIRIERASEFLGGITFNKLTAISGYKLR